MFILLFLRKCVFSFGLVINLVEFGSDLVLKREDKTVRIAKVARRDNIVME